MQLNENYNERECDGSRSCMCYAYARILRREEVWRERDSKGVCGWEGLGIYIVPTSHSLLLSNGGDDSARGWSGHRQAFH